MPRLRRLPDHIQSNIGMMFMDCEHGYLPRSSGRRQWARTIGIVGGLGPFAHIELEKSLLRATIDILGPAASDQDFPPWILSSLPGTPDRTAAVLAGGPSPISALLASLRRLDGADFAIIPCLSAHPFLAALRELSPLPILDVAGATVEALGERVTSAARVGLLATSATLATDIFGQAARRRLPGIKFVTPADLGHDAQQRAVMRLIFGGGDLGGGIKGGAHLDPVIGPLIRMALCDLIDQFREIGATAVILGCTELSVLAETANLMDDIVIIDPLAVAAAAAVRVAVGRCPLP